MCNKHGFFKLILFIPISLVFLLSSCFEDYNMYNYHKDGPLSDLYEASVKIDKEVEFQEKGAEIRQASLRGNEEEIEKAEREYGELKEVFFKKLKAEYDVTQIQIPYEYKGENTAIKISGIEFSEILFKGNMGDNNFDLLLSIKFDIVGDPPPYDFIRIELLNPQNNVLASYHQVIKKEGVATFPLRADMGLSYLHKIHIY